MKLFLKIPGLFLLIVFLQAGMSVQSAAQKSSIRYANPQKELKKTIRRVRKENRLAEKRRRKQFKERGIGADRKSKRIAAREKKQEGKTGSSYLDRVLTDKKEVSPAEKQAAYKRDRKLTRTKSRQKSRMKRNRIKKRKPSKGN